LWPSKGQICFIKWCLHVESSIIIPDKFLSTKNQLWMKKSAGFLASIYLFICFQMVCVYIDCRRFWTHSCWLFKHLWSHVLYVNSF
jgi:hypothetical protein